MDITKRLVDFAVNIRYEDLPPEVIDRGKDHVLDTLACILAAGKEETALIMLQYVRALEGGREASIIGFRDKTTAQLAALFNGTVAHALDFDDCQPSFSGHPSVVILPAALAVAEKLHASGKAVIEAYMVAFEVACKIGKGVNPDLFERGWHATSVIGVLGAAMAAGKLLHLDAKKMAFALALAASQASGLKGNFGTMGKAFHAGKAAESGVTAAILSENGFTACPDILDVKNGFCDVFSRQYDLGAMIQGLGSPFDIVSPGVITKVYPSCLFTHPIIQATHWLVRSEGVRAKDVESIECRITPLASDSLIHNRPRSGLEAKFSAPYSVAVAMLHHEISLQEFADETVQGTDSVDIMRKVTVVADPEIEASRTGEWRGLGARLTVRLKDGRECTKVVAITGDEDATASRETIISKYKGCARTVLDAECVGESIDRILRLETIGDIGTLTAIIASNKS
jgi:2-methylcitrate dehydratase PrpD